MGGSERGRVGGQHTTGRQGLVAVLVVLGLALLATVWVLSLDPFEGDRPPAPAPGESGAPGVAPTPAASDDSADPAASVTRLAVDAAPARCLPPSARTLARQDLAVDAVVEDVPADGSSGVVTLRPTQFLAGARTDLVEVDAPDGDLVALLGATEFTVGDRYLVSATDGSVSVCGLSGPWTPRLERLYEEAWS